MTIDSTELLVSSDELFHEIRSYDDNVVIIDCRHNPRDFSWGRQQFKVSHIPHATHFHLKDDLSGEVSGFNGRHPLPNVNKLSHRLCELMTSKHKHIVVYDDSGSNYAARCWWVLRWLGYKQVSILDGGWNKWVSEGRPVMIHSSSIKNSIINTDDDYTEHNHLIVSDTFIIRNLNDINFCLIDARHPDSFSGDNEWQDPVAGHIPGALNHFYKENLSSTDTFKTKSELKEIYHNLLHEVEPQNVIHSCGSGVNACCNIFAMELAGLTGSKLYPGSWSEWCSNGSRPMIRFA